MTNSYTLRKLLEFLYKLDIKSADIHIGQGCAMCGYYQYGCWNC